MKPIATLKRLALCAAILGVMLTALPAVASGSADDCDPTTCTSPVETR